MADRWPDLVRDFDRLHGAPLPSIERRRSRDLRILIDVRNGSAWPSPVFASRLPSGWC